MRPTYTRLAWQLWIKTDSKTLLGSTQRDPEFQWDPRWADREREKDAQSVTELWDTHGERMKSLPQNSVLWILCAENQGFLLCLVESTNEWVHILPGKEIKCRDRHFGEPSIHASKQHLERFPTQCDSVFSRSFLSAKLLIRLDSSSARISSQCSCSIWRDTISERSSSVSNPGNFTHFLTSPSLSLFILFGSNAIPLLCLVCLDLFLSVFEIQN